MASEWASVSLGEVIIDFDSRRKPVKGSDRRSGPYPYYGASGVVDHVDGFLFEGRHLLIAEDGENLKTRQTPIAFLADGKYWVNNHAHVVKANSQAITEFLCYALAQVSIQPYLTGSTMPKLTQGNMRRIQIPLPPMEDQRRIVAILGALDDKIALLRETNATLEAIAQALFKSWFVDFYPVCAKAEGRDPEGVPPGVVDLFPSEFEESELGAVPKGWRVGTLGEVIQILDYKRVPLSSGERAKRQGTFPYYGAAALMDHVDDYLFDGIYLLMGEDGSVTTPDGTPVLQYVWGKLWVNNHAHVLLGKGAFSTEHIMLFLKRTNITAYVTGAVQAKLNQGNLNRIPFILPSETVAIEFANQISPLFASIRANKEQSRTLQDLRDTLLPRLMSGKLQILNVEEDTA